MREGVRWHTDVHKTREAHGVTSPAHERLRVACERLRVARAPKQRLGPRGTCASPARGAASRPPRSSLPPAGGGG
eukprot:6577449-Prymnesium_polylepis.1